MRILLSLAFWLFFAHSSLTNVSSASAFDNNRQGFVLGFGVGLGAMEVDSETESFLGLQTDLKIGGGVSNQLLVHYTGKQFWFNDDDFFFTLANPMIGLTYYVLETSPSVFITGGVGLSLVGAFSDNAAGAGAGLGFFAGVGYEFHPKWNLELDVIRSRFQDVYLWNFTMTVNVLGY